MQVVTLRVDGFYKTGGCQDCNCGGLTAYDGGDMSSAPAWSFCDPSNVNNREFTSAGNTLVLVFRKPPSEPHSGFSLSYKTVAPSSGKH